MKLRNKKTGKIIEVDNIFTFAENKYEKYDSLKEFNKEWEDYEEPKDFWNIEWNGAVCHTTETFEEEIRLAKEIGNYFETKEEAEKAVEKLKAWKRIKDKGFRFAGWDMRNGDGGYEPSIGFELNGVTDVLEKDEIAQEIVQDLDLLFGGEE